MPSAVGETVTTQSASFLTIETRHDRAALQSEDARDRALARIRASTSVPLPRSQLVIEIVSKSSTDFLMSLTAFGSGGECHRHVK